MWELIIAQRAARVARAQAARDAARDALNTLRAAVDGNGPVPSGADIDEAAQVHRAATEALDAAIASHDEAIAERDADAELTARAERVEVTPAAARRDAAAGHESRAVVTQESGPYRPDTDRTGSKFVTDVVQAALGSSEARESLTRASAAARDELRRVGLGDVRAAAGSGDVHERAIGSSAVSGFVVPPYLTDLYGKSVSAGAPTIAAMAGRHELPPTGMSVIIPRITTAPSVATQLAEGDLISETDMDDTLHTVPVRTTAGMQTVSRQSVERGLGVEGVLLEDLGRRYSASRDNVVLNTTTTGLTNAAATVAYTDASPTVAELYPRILAALSAEEAALLDQAAPDSVVVMHSRRWYWMQAALGSAWPLLNQSNTSPQALGEVDAASFYGSGFRGFLPNGLAVVVDNNVATNLGVGTNEDELYIFSRREAHLWEDGDGTPRIIRAEVLNRLQLQVALYGYWAFTFQRQPHAQKLAGTGLVTPSF